MRRARQKFTSFVNWLASEEVHCWDARETQTFICLNLTIKSGKRRSSTESEWNSLKIEKLFFLYETWDLASIDFDYFLLDRCKWFSWTKKKKKLIATKSEGKSFQKWLGYLKCSFLCAYLRTSLARIGKSNKFGRNICVHNGNDIRPRAKLMTIKLENLFCVLRLKLF